MLLISLSGRTFLAVAGVTHYEALRPAFAQLRENGTTDIIEAYDMDKETNPHGAESLYEYDTDCQ